MARILVIANQKGGVGKTTTAVNLSTCLADRDQRVLLVDIDPQGNTTSGLGVDKKNLTHSIYDVLINELPVQEAILPTEVPRLSLLPSNIELAGAELEMAPFMAREMVLARALEPVGEEYDFILIDTPPSLGLLSLNGLGAAREVLIPIQCEFYALEGLSQLLNTIKLVRRHINSKLEVEGVVLTMFDGRTNLSVQVVEEVKSYFKGKVHSVIIPRNIRLGEAPSHGLPITQYSPNCAGAEAYRDLAEEILGE